MNRLMALTFAALGLVGGCAAAPAVYVRGDQPLSSPHRTFAVGSVEHALPAFRRTPLPADVLGAARNDLVRTLSKRGYHEAPLGTADLIVCVSTGARRESVASSDQDALGNTSGSLDSDGPFQYDELTLVIDVFDAGHRRRLWHGAARETSAAWRNDRAALNRTIEMIVARLPRS